MISKERAGELREWLSQLRTSLNELRELARPGTKENHLDTNRFENLLAILDDYDADRPLIEAVEKADFYGHTINGERIISADEIAILDAATAYREKNEKKGEGGKW